MELISSKYEYKILEKWNVEALETEVNKKLQEGWRLYEGLMFDSPPTRYIQIVIRNKENNHAQE